MNEEFRVFFNHLPVSVTLRRELFLLFAGFVKEMEGKEEKAVSRITIVTWDAPPHPLAVFLGEVVPHPGAVVPSLGAALLPAGGGAVSTAIATSISAGVVLPSDA